MGAVKFVKRPTGTTPTGTTELTTKAYVDAGQPRGNFRQTSSQSLTNNTWTLITFDAEDRDTASGHSTVSNTSRYTCQVAGDYWITGAVAFAFNASGYRGTLWRKNGADLDGSQLIITGNTNVATIYVARTRLISLAVSDYLEICGIQASGGSLSTAVSASEQSSMTVLRVGD